MKTFISILFLILSIHASAEVRGTSYPLSMRATVRQSAVAFKVVDFRAFNVTERGTLVVDASAVVDVEVCWKSLSSPDASCGKNSNGTAKTKYGTQGKFILIVSYPAHNGQHSTSVETEFGQKIMRSSENFSKRVITTVPVSGKLVIPNVVAGKVTIKLAFQNKLIFSNAPVYRARTKSISWTYHPRF